LRYIQKSLALRERLAKDHPDDGELQRNLTVTYDRRAGLHVESGEVEEALDLYRRSLAAREQLAAADPADARATRDLMSSHVAIGDAHLASGDYRQAAESFGRAADVSRRMIASGMNARQSEAELGACEAKQRKAEALMVALGAWDALLQQPAELLPTLLEARAVECLRRERFEEAARAARQLREVAGASANQLYNAACVLARAADAIQPAEGQRELTDAQALRRDACTRDALATLREAIDAGWDDFEHLRQDEDLALLRELPEFQAVLPVEESCGGRLPGP
jgi:tetratricopeptide (TPR) repeat protein